jgi:hypothetical protein
VCAPVPAQDISTEFVWHGADGGDAAAVNAPLVMRVRGEARPGKGAGGKPPRVPRNVSLLVYVGTTAGRLNLVSGRKDDADTYATFARVRVGSGE